jgi:hypothetical protein
MPSNQINVFSMSVKDQFLQMQKQMVDNQLRLLGIMMQQVQPVDLSVVRTTIGMEVHVSDRLK